MSSAPPLPEPLSHRIRDLADRHANDLGPKLRQLLARPSLTAGLETFSHTISGRELVHTSYFDHPEVIELLVMNIDWSRQLIRPRRSSTSAEIKRWFDDFKRLQGAAPKRQSSLRWINRDWKWLADDKRAA